MSLEEERSRFWCTAIAELATGEKDMLELTRTADDIGFDALMVYYNNMRTAQTDPGLKFKVPAYIY